MQTSISKRLSKHTLLRSLFSTLLALSSLNHLAHAQSPIQPLQNDPAIRQQLNRKNYEPSNTPNPNNLFPFGGHRGTVEHRTGSIRITNNQTTPLGGGVELQQLNYKGEIGFHTRFTNHGWEVHSPFDEHASKTGYGKGQSISDGYGPSSYAYTIKGTMVHPADGYEAPQGGGYPTPSKYGAHDRYNIKVSGQARRMVQKPLDRNFGWKQAWENTKHAGRTGIENAIHAGRKMDTPLVTYDRNQGFWTNSQTNIRNMLGRMNGKIEGALLIPSTGLHTAVGLGSAAVDSYQYNRDYQNYKKDIQQQKNMDERTLFWHLYGMGEQYTQKQLGKEPLKQVGQDIAEKANNFAQKYPTTTEAAELGFNLWGAGVVGKNSVAAVARSGADDFAGAVAARAAQQKLPNAGSVSHVNPTKSDFNCTNCAFSVDNQLATGAKSSALPRENGVPFSELNKLYGTQFSNDMSRHQIENLLRSYGNGTRAIIYGADKTGQYGHVWNATVQKGIVNYIDGQTGKGGAKNFDTFNRNLRVGITKKGIEND